MYRLHRLGHSTVGRCGRDEAGRDGQAWKSLVCFPVCSLPHSGGLRWRYALLPGHISLLLPAHRAPGLLGKLEVKWNCWTLPCSGVGQAGDVGEMAWPDLSTPGKLPPWGRGRQVPVRVSGPWASPLETNPSSSTFFPSRETPRCFPAWEDPWGCGGRPGLWVGVGGRQAGPAEDGASSCPLVCLWILSLQAKEEEPSGGRGPSLPRKRYLQRVWVGRAVCFVVWRG